MLRSLLKLRHPGKRITYIASKEADSLNNGAIRATASHKFETPPDMLIGRLSFSHIREIMAIDDPFERFFYEFECIKGT